MTHAAGVASPRPGARPFAVAVGVTLVLMVLSAVVALGWRSQLQGEGREEFDLGATEAQQLVVQRLQSAIGVLQEAEAAVDEEGAALSAESFERAVAAALPQGLPSMATVSLVERVAETDLPDLVADRRAAGLPEFRLRDVHPGSAPPAIATFEASTRGAPILAGYDLRSIPALRPALAPDAGQAVRISSRLEALPASVARVHPDLGRSSFALVVPAGRDGWLLALLSGDELAGQAAAVDDDLDVALAVAGSPLGASNTTPEGAAVDLSGVPADARTVRPFTIEGGPLLVTVADLDGLSGGGWREPGLLLGAGIALSVLVGSLILVLARGRAGALLEASAAQQARARSEENFRAVVQHLSDLVVVADEDRFVEFVTPSVNRLLGRKATALTGANLEDLVHPDDRPLLRALSSGDGVSDTGLIRFGHSDGSDRTFEVVVANRLQDPAVGGLVLTGHDVTDRVALEDRLAHDATHDALTGLPNRTLLCDRLEQALVRAQRTGRRVAVVFGDLDGFKAVNDERGHLVGDAILVEVATRLRGATRAMDTVGRFAGDEFIVICEDLDDEAGARLAAERYHREVVQPFVVDGVPVEVAMSLGVAMVAPGDTVDAVLRRADGAMYRAKADHRITFAA